MTTEIVFRDATYKIPDRLRASDGRLYSVDERLGAGGNGVVYQCSAEADGEVYAIKFLTSLRDEKRRLRFALEQNIMAALAAEGHDHLVRFVTAGNVSAATYNRRAKKDVEIEIPYVIMEKADRSLRELIREASAPVSSAIYMAQFRGLVGALELLHKHAVHRDIKPDNILVIGDRWVISDFGLCSAVEPAEGADLTQHLEVVGPRFWMSPEANNRAVGLSEDITFASDVFQLAAVFWWVVNRRHPSGILAREDWRGMEKLYAPIVKALQHSMERRFVSAAEFGHAVTNAIEA